MSKEETQPFENYPKLAELLLVAAHTWKTDDTWSATLGEINNVCRENASLKADNDRLRKALEEIQTISSPRPTIAFYVRLRDIVDNALKQQP